MKAIKMYIFGGIFHVFYFILGKNNIFFLCVISQKPFLVVNYGSCPFTVNFHHNIDKHTK